MQFINLPEEILIIIIRKLDVKSQYRLYNTCKLLRNVVSLQGVIKHCCLSLNSMATANTLSLNFFKDLCNNLQELNMCGVVDLCKTKLLPTLKKLKRLKVLDVSYTEVTISDLMSIHEMCPTIKDISINFVWKCKTFEVPSSILLACQKVFEKFENVKFIGSFDSLIYSRLPLYLLEKSKLHKLKFVVIKAPFARKSDISSLTFPEFDHFTLNVLDWNFGGTITALSEHWSNSHILSMLLLKDCEYIVMITYAYDLKIYTSPSFINFFKDMFNIEVETKSLSKIDFLVSCRYTGLQFMVWNKATTIFDEKFYSALSKHVKQYVPYKFEFQVDCEVPPPKKFDLFYISPTPYFSKKDDVIEDSHSIKRKRVAAPNFVLNYDVLFKEEEKVELVLHFKHALYNVVALTNSSMYLSKLTYLSLIDVGRYSSDFFRILFCCCVNLVTLNVRNPLSTQCASAISHSIALTKSLKNLRISENMINFNKLFLSLCQCLSLENIYITDSSIASANCDYSYIGYPGSLVAVLDNLYSIYIEAPVSQSAVKKSMVLFNKTKKKHNKHHINFEVNSTYEKGYLYHPYVSVFKFCAITTV